MTVRNVVTLRMLGLVGAIGSKQAFSIKGSSRDRFTKKEKRYILS